jgi:hypothetical protein
MPYLHCARCRITVYKPRHLLQPAQKCPRCDAWLSTRPRPLIAPELPSRLTRGPFDKGARKPNRGLTPRPGTAADTDSAVQRGGGA